MTYTELHTNLKQLTSRGVVLCGMGCVEVYVPYKSKKIVELYLYDTLHCTVHLEVHTLKERKITMKKGVFEFGKVGGDGTKHFINVCNNYSLHD